MELCSRLQLSRVKSSLKGHGPLAVQGVQEGAARGMAVDPQVPRRAALMFDLSIQLARLLEFLASQLPAALSQTPFVQARPAQQSWSMQAVPILTQHLPVVPQVVPRQHSGFALQLAPARPQHVPVDAQVRPAGLTPLAADRPSAPFRRHEPR